MENESIKWPVSIMERTKQGVTQNVIQAQISSDVITSDREKEDDQ